MKDRKQKEAEFHSRREKDRHIMEPVEFKRKYSNLSFYSITQKSKGDLFSWMKKNCPGKVALDYCCGRGIQTIELAKYGADAYGIDISEEEIRTAIRKSIEEGVQEQTTFSVMDAESMDFDDNFFDLICCSGVLHHLDLKRAYPEIFRVLKPSGKVICVEALGYNPIITLYRKLTPHLRTAWEAEHILTMREVYDAGRYFDEINVDYYHLFSILAIPFRRSSFFVSLLSFFDRIDSILLKLPLIRLMAWQMIFELSRPKK